MLSQRATGSTGPPRGSAAAFRALLHQRLTGVTIPHPFLNQLVSGYAACGCPDPGEGLLLAVSGGADSMALLHGTTRLWSDHRQQIIVAHVNHRMRGDQSRADEEFVSAAAHSLGVRCQVVDCDVPAAVSQDGGSLEEVARRLRYEALQRCAIELGCDQVACAHHQDDQAETVLHHILRGTGLRGLQGMSRTRALGDSVRLIRPLLEVPRADIEVWLREAQLDWRTDDSNLSTEFTRNRIRHQLLPLLAADYNPQVAGSLVRLAELARDAERESEQVAERCLDQVVLELQPGVCRLRRDCLAGWPVSTLRAMLRLIWTRQSWPQQAMTRTHWQQLAVSLQNVESSVADVPGVEISSTPTIVRIFRSADSN